MDKTVQPASSLQGEITLPPDKSISHRAALFAALADGESRIKNYSPAADPQSTLSCLQQLGVPVTLSGDQVTIQGVGRDGLSRPDKPLDCGNSGTTMRLLSGIVAGAGVPCSLVGDDSLSSRTMKRIIDPLRSMGAVMEGSADGGSFAPLHIQPHHGIQGIRFPLPIASAQLKSCVLLAGLFGEEPTDVIESVPSRDHTERLLDLESEPFGSGKLIRSSRHDLLPEQNYSVPADFSAAAFWLVAGAIHSDASITMPGVGINPSRIGALHILKEMGASITLSGEAMEGREPVAELTVGSSALQPIEIDPALIPNCIDELPVLMVAMCFANGTSVIRGAEELRHKETDRLSAMFDILQAAGATATLKDDGIAITGRPDFKPSPAAFTTYHDHRMAMAAAVLSLRSGGTCTIRDAECTAISYPGFWNDLSALSA
ncbi:MAG: 3-phosphoshikimate 1-carboxyvinyltransferase [Balneolaceae bacterium]